jgi:hypothetical protein
MLKAMQNQALLPLTAPRLYLASIMPSYFGLHATGMGERLNYVGGHTDMGQYKKNYEQATTYI